MKCTKGKSGKIHRSQGIDAEGKLWGKSVVDELERASTWISCGMANIFRIVIHNGVTYYVNPTLKKQRRIADPGELLFDAGGDHQPA